MFKRLLSQKEYFVGNYLGVKVCNQRQNSIWAQIFHHTKSHIPGKFPVTHVYSYESLLPYIICNSTSDEMTQLRPCVFETIIE